MFYSDINQIVAAKVIKSYKLEQESLI